MIFANLNIKDSQNNSAESTPNTLYSLPNVSSKKNDYWRKVLNNLNLK